MRALDGSTIFRCILIKIEGEEYGEYNERRSER